eukprot:2514179-Rhodomonas_salina.1
MGAPRGVCFRVKGLELLMMMLTVLWSACSSVCAPVCSSAYPPRCPCLCVRCSLRLRAGVGRAGAGVQGGALCQAQRKPLLPPPRPPPQSR